MVEITPSQRGRLAPLFQGWEETLIWSVLQGCMGRAWADEGGCPRAALLWIGDFGFLGGDAHAPGAGELAAFIPPEFAGSGALLVPQNREWLALLEQVHGKRGEPITRYAIRKEPQAFDRARLRAFRDSLPKGYSLRLIDRELYGRVLQTPWARDFCAQFGSWEEYAAHGAGYVALYGEELAAGASSYSWYQGGIEIEVDTKREHRRRGLALCCASALILHCLDRGLYPSWDAATPISVALAERLGYHFSHEYPCLLVQVEKPSLRETGWLFFDIGSTLVDEREGFRLRIEKALEGTGVAYQDFTRRMEEHYRQGRNGDKLAFAELGIPRPPWTGEGEFPYPEAKDCLRRLSDRYKLGIIANQPLGTAARLERYGLLPYLSVVASSAEEGVSKPDPALFRTALERAGCPPERALMVGDRLDNDIVPAKALGMKTLWVRQGFWRHAAPQAPEETPDFTVWSLQEAVRLLLGEEECGKEGKENGGENA